MNTKHNLSLSIYQYVRGLYKGKGKSLGEIASEARSFELDLNVWIDVLESKEGLIR
jgi:hypothetical protein